MNRDWHLHSLGHAQSARPLVAACALAVALMPTSALADAIDGSWCREAMNFTIAGSSITTPSGRQLSGNYSRHGFSYVAPPEEPDPGSEIDMHLVNDEHLEITRRVGQVTKPSETWRRCKPIS